MTVTAVVDRFEDGFAVLENPETGALLDFPRDLLPPGTRPGDHLHLTAWSVDAHVTPAPDETAAARDRVRNVQERLRAKRGPPE